MRSPLRSAFIVAVLALFSGCTVQKSIQLDPLKPISESEKKHICDNKTPQECNNAGVGFEIKEDFKRAEICYQKACDSDLGVACSNLGSLYQKFDDNSSAKALPLFIKSCNLNSSYGCYNAANAYRLGSGTDYDFVRAIKLYEKACIELKHAMSCTNLGGMHQFSLGVEVASRDIAKKYYKMGCELKDEVGCRNLSLIGE